MKRLKISILALAGAAMIFASCEKDDPKEVNVTSSATITGNVQAQLDLRNDTNFVTNLENVEGVNIYARISTADLTTNVDPNFNYPSKVYKATTDADGNYELNVKAGSKTVSVEIYGDEFKRDVVLDSNNNTQSVNFSMMTDSITVTHQQTKIYDIVYQ
ncbi:MAG: hypothetical protein RI562_09740 [Salibacter sp.]|uniref:hypothetical protein n=1 Tax=Salibacter sp. TaxID=2010995 RepID=UPI00286FB08E|nr:hypothetical protein [Salibacter sp.]MDR9399334.1 hypothetical protein [Salibacter sp.]